MNRYAVALSIVASLAGKAVAEESCGKVVAITDDDTLKVPDEASVQHRIVSKESTPKEEAGVQRQGWRG